MLYPNKITRQVFHLVKELTDLELYNLQQSVVDCHIKIYGNKPNDNLIINKFFHVNYPPMMAPALSKSPPKNAKECLAEASITGYRACYTVVVEWESDIPNT